MYQGAGDPRQQDHVHLHMHHVCPCVGLVYPYPSPYRPLVSYAQTRPYNLHHYQYTQFNMVPYASPAVLPQLPVGVAALGPQGAPDVAFGPPPADRRAEEGAKPDSDPSPADGFVRFLEESCLKAEHIAYRNRNRPCFRNIQNLCMRTRSEIVKPCTTISNIHSQGIPWATKDFIYAFIRLVNCWHILKGYLEKGGSLGKIERELGGDFKACYRRWEKDSMELAVELRRIFCNLDANISSSSAHARKGEAEDGPSGKPASRSGSETTKDGDSDNDGRVYMKPGSYSVPKRDGSANNSPRSYEFLETAQNVHKNVGRDADRVWKSAQVAAPGLISRMELERPGGQEAPAEGADVQAWIDTGLYAVRRELDGGSKPVTVLRRSKEENHPRSHVGEMSKEVAGKLKEILDDLRATEFALYFHETEFDDDFKAKAPSSLSAIYKKIDEGRYGHVSEVVQDLKDLVLRLKMFFNSDNDVLLSMPVFVKKLETCLQQSFPEQDFSAFAQENDNVSAAVIFRKKLEGDGDH